MTAGRPWYCRLSAPLCKGDYCEEFAAFSVRAVHLPACCEDVLAKDTVREGGVLTGQENTLPRRPVGKQWRQKTEIERRFSLRDTVRRLGDRFRCIEGTVDLVGTIGPRSNNRQNNVPDTSRETRF